MKKLLLVILVVLLLCGCTPKPGPGSTVENNPENLIYTEYFTITLPEDLQGKCEYSIETFDDSTYELTLYRKEGLKENKEIFNIRLFPMYQIADGYSLTHGILATPKGDYELFSRLPEGVEFSPENLDAYDAVVDEYARIADGLVPMEGCEHFIPQLEAPAEEVEDILVETRYYTLTMPVDFYNNCELHIFPADEEGPDALVMYELSSFKTDCGGHLCSILLIPHGEDYDYYPDHEWIGVLETPEGDFDIVVLYPTDVQFSDETAAAYNEMVQYLQDLFNSLRPRDGIGLVLP